MSNDAAMFSRAAFKALPEDLRIGMIISDGMWYSQPKWRQLAKCSEEGLQNWIDEHIANGTLIQASTGAMSYRFDIHNVRQWYFDNDFEIGTRLVEGIFPPRIWDDMTETEGFLQAPLREIGVVSFLCSNTKAADEVREALYGIARVRRDEPGKYRAYGLDAAYVKAIVQEVFSKYPESDVGRVYSHAAAKRREIVDFSAPFARGLIDFYRRFGKSLVKRSMSTISIFIPDPEDQDTQMFMWVIEAIEKFDQSEAVPFSGYFNSALNKWPFNLPTQDLGKELSKFQRFRSRAIKELTAEKGTESHDTDEIASRMGYSRDEFWTYEEQNQNWIAMRNSGTLTWDENGEDKVGAVTIDMTGRTDIDMAHALSRAVIDAALETGKFDDADRIIDQVDRPEIDKAAIGKASPLFVQALGNILGM